MCDWEKLYFLPLDTAYIIDVNIVTTYINRCANRDSNLTDIGRDLKFNQIILRIFKYHIVKDFGSRYVIYFAISI